MLYPGAWTIDYGDRTKAWLMKIEWISISKPGLWRLDGCNTQDTELYSSEYVIPWSLDYEDRTDAVLWSLKYEVREDAALWNLNLWETGWMQYPES